MNINKIVLAVILTLLLYSLIGTVIYIESRENEDIAAIWAIGITVFNIGVIIGVHDLLS